MHADYFSPMKSRIRVFDDRIEFENAGGFPRTIEELLNADITIPSNPVIAKLFRCARLSETAGYGFDKMLLWQKKGGLKVHFFDDKQDMSKVVFERISVTVVEGTLKGIEKGDVTDKVTDNQQKIISAIRQNKNITTSELSEKIGISQRKIKENISKLKEYDCLRRIGPAKGGHWEITVKTVKHSEA
jgi:ATP-dependent DNA helicase RecG